MRCSLFDRASLIRLALIALALCVCADPGFARAHAPRAGTPAPVDTIHIDVPLPPMPPMPPMPSSGVGRKRIIIGGSGVRIVDEGADSDSSDGSFHVDVNTRQERSGDNIVRVGESVYVAPGEVVPGDVVVFGGNAVIEGTVTGSVVVLGGEIRARSGSEVKGDIVSIGGKITEDEDVVIRGEKIVVGGIATRVGDSLDLGGRALRAIFSAMVLFVSIILFFITMLFLRGRVERTSDYLSGSLLRTFGAGILASIVLDFGIAIVTIPLIITIVGIPLAVILVLSYVGVFVIACTVFVHSVGRAISVRTGMGGGTFARLVIGFAVLSIPEFAAFVVDSVANGPMSFYVFLQVVSAVIWLFAYVVGLGAIVLSRFGTVPPIGSEPPAQPVQTEFVPSPTT
jgi:hypothetical protein